MTTNFPTAEIGSVLLSSVSVSETDNGAGSFNTFDANFTTGGASTVFDGGNYDAYTDPFSPYYAGVIWGGLVVNVAASGQPTDVTQAVTFSEVVSAGPGSILTGSYANLVNNDSGSGGWTAVETITDTLGNVLATTTWDSSSASSSDTLSIGGAYTTVDASLVITDTVPAGTTGTAGFSVAELAFSTTSEVVNTPGTTGISVVKQVLCGGTWETTTPSSMAMAIANGSNDVQFRVIVTDTGTIGETATVTDSYPGVGATLPDFTFGGATSVALAAGGSATSDVFTLLAQSGTIVDTATATGAYSPGSGLPTGTVTATATAEYTGATASVAIDKEVSTDGTTWYNVGTLNSGGTFVTTSAVDPSTMTGDAVYFRVVVANTGQLAISSATVGDSYTGGSSSFLFGTADATTTGIGVGQTVTSDVLTLTAPATMGTNWDTATVTGTVTDTCGNSSQVTTTGSADYTTTTCSSGSISIDKQVEVNGTWYDVGNGTLQDPAALVGSEVYVRVIVTNTGSLTIGGVRVGDVGPGAPSGFTFGSSGYCGPSSSVSIGAGQSVTSNAVGVCAQVGYNMDTATVTGTISVGGTSGGGGSCGGGSWGSGSGGSCGSGSWSLGCGGSSGGSAGGGGGTCTTTVVSACDVADYTGVKASVAITKYVSVDGGGHWLTYNACSPPQALIGGTVEYQVVVTNTGTTALTGVNVGDAGGAAVTGFVFGGTADLSSITLAAGASATSDVASTTALCGVNTDTATVTGTVAVGSGSTTVSAFSKADYQGIPGAVGIDKQVSVDGGKTWQDAGHYLQDPTAAVGSTVEFRVILSDTGGSALTGLAVGDANGGSVTGFTFGGKTTLASLAVGQSVTSDIGSTKALSGHQVDTATVTAGTTLNGAAATVTAADQADYTGGSGSGCGSGGWGGSGGSSGSSGWGCTTSSGDGYSCGSDSTGWGGSGCWGGSSGDLCGQYGQAQKVEFCYKPSDCVSQQGLQSGLATCSGHDGCGSAFIEITNSANAYQSGAACYYQGSVGTGQDFFASCGSGSFGSEIYVHCFSSQSAFNQHQAACQNDTYVCNGSQSINLGDQVGCVTVTGYVGHSGSFCT
jgi:hypothetical protein